MIDSAMDILEHIAEIEERFASREEKICAFVPEEGRFERLRRDARELMARYPESTDRPAMFGVLTGVKDIFHVDGFPTRAGSRVPAEELEGHEAACVSKLKAAGALILGKTVTTEFAYFAPGPTRNPHNPAHTPGGSSSGSAAAVAAGLCPLALGTQTIGSIIRPAAYCGVVGFKPSYERVSRGGVIPLAPALDHVGFFTPDVPAAKSAASLLLEGWSAEDVPRRKPVLGVPTGPYLDHVSEEGMIQFQDNRHKLSAAGFNIVEVAAMPDFEEISDRHNLILAAQAARVHARWFEDCGDRYHAKTAQLIRRGQAIPDAGLVEHLAGRERVRGELERLMDDYGIDAWISPSAPGAAPQGLDSTGDPVMNLPWTHAGMPAINLPAGDNPIGLPLGLQVTARFHADELLLGFAGEIEAAMGEAYGGRET